MPQHTPLYDRCQQLGARMTEFGGWQMPVQFSGIRQEHQAVRQSAGMFDISHMGKFELAGSGLLAALEQLVPSRLTDLQLGQARYTVLLTPEGGIVDDLIVYFQGENEAGEQQAVLIVNAATTQKDAEWLRTQLPGAIRFENRSQGRVLIAVQGPQAVAKLQGLTETDLGAVKRYWHTAGTVAGAPAFLARTGYTGEDGFEVMADASGGLKIWQGLRDQGVVPCGLGARDTLRLEAAMALYGQDVTEQTTPLEAGLSWLVDWEKGNFVGRDALQQQKQAGVTRRLVGLQLEGRNIARHDYPVQHDGDTVGTVTSGTLSPTLGYPIALASVPPGLAKVGQTLGVEIRGNVFPATVVKRPFYKRSM